MKIEEVKKEIIEKASALINDGSLELDVRFQFEKEIETSNPSALYEYGVETKNVACSEEEATKIKVIHSVDGYTGTIYFENPFDNGKMVDIIAKEMYYTFLNMSE